MVQKRYYIETLDNGEEVIRCEIPAPRKREKPRKVTHHEALLRRFLDDNPTFARKGFYQDLKKVCFTEECPDGDDEERELCWTDIRSGCHYLPDAFVFDYETKDCIIVEIEDHNRTNTQKLSQASHPIDYLDGLGWSARLICISRFGHACAMWTAGDLFLISIAHSAAEERWTGLHPDWNDIHAALILGQPVPSGLVAVCRTG